MSGFVRDAETGLLVPRRLAEPRGLSTCNLAASCGPAFFVGGGSSWTPLQLFAGGIGGAYYEMTDSSTLFSDTGLTTPATSGGVVKGVKDKSGNGINLINSASGCTRNASGLGVDFSGTGSSFTPSGGLGGIGSTSGWTLIGVIRSTTATSGSLLDADFQSSARITQGLRFSSNAFFSLTFGTPGGGNIVSAASAASSAAANTDYVVSSQRSLTSSDQIQVNGVGSGNAATTVTNVASVTSGGSFVVGAAYEGTSTPSQSPLTGRIASVLFIYRPLTTGERSQAQTYMGALIGLIV